MRGAFASALVNQENPDRALVSLRAFYEGVPAIKNGTRIFSAEEATMSDHQKIAAEVRQFQPQPVALRRPQYGSAQPGM